MSDKAAAVNGEVGKKSKAEGSKKKGSKGKHTSQLDNIVAEAKAAYGDISTTGERKLRKRPESSRPAAPVKKAAKKTGAKKADKKSKAADASNSAD